MSQLPNNDTSIKKKISIKTKLIIILTITLIITISLSAVSSLVLLKQQIQQSLPGNEIDKIFGQIVPIIVTNSAITLMLLLILTYLLARKVLKPLQQIEQIVSNLATGKLNNPINIQSNDELENISQNLNQATTNIQLNFQKLIQERQIILTKTNRLEIALATITDAVIAVDLNRNVTVFNKAAENITNLPESQVLGRPIGEVLRVFDKKDEISPITYCPIGRDGFEGVMYYKEGLRLLGNGKESCVNLTCKQIRTGVNAQLGGILTLKDITREKQLEAMQLDFVSMAAHELRTPLTSIKGYLSVFMEENRGKFSGDQEMFLNRIDSSAQRLINLVENLLNVTRVERSALNVNRQATDMVILAKQTVSDLSFRAMDKKINLQFVEPTQPIPQVAADKMRISEVITNLIANAINYTAPGGFIRVFLEANQQEVITHVQDSGVGIPKEALNHLFTKFFRVSNKLEMGSKGTGLGLYISKAIIDLHHGRIWVESEVGKGSTFSFSLPINSATSVVA